MGECAEIVVKDAAAVAFQARLDGVEHLFDLDPKTPDPAAFGKRSCPAFFAPLQADLRPRTVYDGVDSEHLVCHIRATVESMDIRALLGTYRLQGGVAYDPRQMLSTILFGMADGVRSSRELQEHCRYDARYRYLMGGHVPDDRTFGRFLERVGPYLEDLFTQIVQAGKRKGLVSGGEVAIDGVKTAGNTSSWKHAQRMKEEKKAKSAKSKKKKKKDGTVEAEPEACGSVETTKPEACGEGETSAPKACETGETSGAEACGAGEAVPERKEPMEPPSDPDVRTMTSHGRIMAGYNVQAAVDTGGVGMILGMFVTNEQNDYNCASRVLKSVKKHLGSYPSAAIADSGYDSSRSIREVTELGVDTVFAPKSELPKGLSLDGDLELTCRAGRKLSPGGTFEGSPGQMYQKFSIKGGCRDCPFKKICEIKGKRVHVAVGSLPEHQFLNVNRYDSEAYKGAMIRRRKVEIPFGQFKGNDKFTRFLRRGINKVEAEFALWAISYNVRKLRKSPRSVFLAFFKEFFRNANAKAPCYSLLGSNIKHLQFHV